MSDPIKFIVGCDEKGKNIEISCDPKEMFAEQNKSYLAKSDPYLTVVAFRKEVLDKYYANPDNYSVQDGVLWIGREYLCIDNNHDEYIAVYLGDLRILEDDEHHHWRSHNICVKSPQMSGVSVARNLYCEFSKEPTNDVFLFKNKLNQFNKIFAEKYGWHIFRPLEANDKHNLESLANLSLGNQKQFDEGVLRLAKILVDSIDVKEIHNIVNLDEKEIKNKGSVYKLERFFSIEKISNSSDLIRILKSIQGLRSSGSAHRKGSNYAKQVNKLSGDSLQEKYTLVLKDCTLYLDQITTSLKAL